MTLSQDDTPDTTTPAVKTTALAVPSQWIETPRGEVTTLHRVCVSAIDFYPDTRQVPRATESKP